MSFSIDIEVQDVDGNTQVLPVITGMYGSSKPMWEKALGEGAPSNLDGIEARALATRLDAAARDSILNEQDYRDIEEARGLASFRAFRDALFALIRTCHKYPYGTIRHTN
ncbi:MAG: hypothetical protein J7474_04565 [Arthrobacter sp.]|nr:hypothetical protein [Arthrobacter sp.]